MIEYAVLGGFVLDCLFGDPAWLPHPVVYMGKAISALEKRLRARLPKTPQGELLGGAIVAFCLPVGTFLLTSLVCLGAARISPWLGLAVQMFWCGQALAAKGLAQESTNVYRELVMMFPFQNFFTCTKNGICLLFGQQSKFKVSHSGSHLGNGQCIDK